MKKSKVLILLLFYFVFQYSFGQSKRIELQSAGSLEGTVYMGQPVRKLTRNVVFKHSGFKLYCELAYQYELKNEMEAFTNVKIIKSNDEKLFGDYMLYNGDTKLCKVSGTKVTLINKNVTLTTTQLDYNLETDLSAYYNKGKVIDNENNLDSQIGIFNKKDNLFTFYKNVVFTDGKYTIYTDTLEYNTNTKIMKFRGASKIVGPDGDMDAELGEYNSVTKLASFNGRTRIVYTDFILFADKVKFSQNSKAGYASGKVEIVSKKDSVTIYGEEAVYNGGTLTTTKVFPFALMRSISSRDTMYISADTLYAINDTVKANKNRKMFAYHKTKVFNKSFQAICDSLMYDLNDSTIKFYKDPVLWTGKNQMRGDTIIVKSKNKKIDRILFIDKAFTISKDTLDNFNQVKGKKMTAFFQKSKINNIEVKGGAETIYYALSGDTAVSGLNHVVSENLTVRFKNQKLKTIAFYKKPKAEFVPPHEINDNIIRLSGFKWREKERPNIEKVAGIYYQFIKLSNKKAKNKK